MAIQWAGVGTPIYGTDTGSFTGSPATPPLYNSSTDQLIFAVCGDGVKAAPSVTVPTDWVQANPDGDFGFLATRVSRPSPPYSPTLPPITWSVGASGANNWQMIYAAVRAAGNISAYAFGGTGTFRVFVKPPPTVTGLWIVVQLLSASPTLPSGWTLRHFSKTGATRGLSITTAPVTKYVWPDLPYAGSDNDKCVIWQCAGGVGPDIVPSGSGWAVGRLAW